MIASIPFLGSSNSTSGDTDRAARTALRGREALRDVALVRRFNGGDEGAFAEIVALHRGRLFAVAFPLLKNRADADEIVQDTFVRAYRGLARFRGDAALGTWLHRIALNLSHNRYRYLYRRCQHTTQSLDSAFERRQPGDPREPHRKRRPQPPSGG